MAYYRSSRGDGISLTVGVLAAVIALAECVGVIVLVNRPAFASAVGLPGGAATWVIFGATAAIVLVVISVLIGVMPRGARGRESTSASVSAQREPL